MISKYENKSEFELISASVMVKSMNKSEYSNDKKWILERNESLKWFQNLDSFDGGNNLLHYLDSFENVTNELL